MRKQNNALSLSQVGDDDEDDGVDEPTRENPFPKSVPGFATWNAEHILVQI